jgi:hypothetical protein
MKFSIGGLDYNYTNFGFVGFYFAPAPYRPGSARMAGFPPKSVVYLDCEQKGPTSRARLAYAGAWADAIRGGSTVFHTKLIAQALRLLRVLVTVGVGGP